MFNLIIFIRSDLKAKSIELMSSEKQFEVVRGCSLSASAVRFVHCGQSERIL